MKFVASLRRSLTLHFIVVATLPILVLGICGFEYYKRKHMETLSGEAVDMLSLI